MERRFYNYKKKKKGKIQKKEKNNKIKASTTKSGIITSDKESEYAGKLANNFDKNEVQNEIDTSVRVSQTFSQTVQEVKAELNSVSDKAKKAKEEAEESLKDKSNLTAEQIDKFKSDIVKSNDKITQMQNVGLLVDTISGALYSPSDSLLGTAANTLSPTIVHEIGQQFKENEQLNKLDDGNRDEQGSTRHILAQALVAGVTAGLSGNDALTAGISSGGAEALAPHLAAYLYGTKPEDLTAEQKQTVSAIISLGSIAVGATSGSVTDMVASGEAGRVAVEENNLAYAATVVIGGAVVREAIYKAGVSALGYATTLWILANHPIDPDAAIMQAIKDKASGGDKTVSTDNHVTKPQTATFNPKPPDDDGDDNFTPAQTKSINKINEIDHMLNSRRNLSGDKLDKGHIEKLLNAQKGLEREVTSLNNSLRNPNLSNSQKNTINSSINTAKTILRRINELTR